MPTGSEIFSRAAILLNDADHVRWPLPELCEWTNDGVKAIALAKPSATSITTALKLEYGTRQILKIEEAPKPQMLIGILRNIVDTTKPYVGGRTIRRVDRALLDASEPNWHDRNYVQFRKEARHFIYSELTPLEYWVYPGNDGTGYVEAEVSVLPPPLAPIGSANAINSYNQPLGLMELYSGPLLDYVLYRCQLKDDIDGAAGRSAVHFQQFATAMGMKVQVEAAHSPNVRR